MADSASGELAACVLRPMRIRRMRLERPPGEEARWLAALMARECGRLGTRIARGRDGALVLRWKSD